MSALEKHKTAELAVVEHAPATLFRTEKPAEVVARASEMARELAKVIKAQKLTTRIQGRDHVRVEGWTLCGTMLGVFPICQWTKKVDNGWEARVEARTLAGQIVGAAEAQCLRSEKTWASRDDYALRSMAQTRATSKALRQPLGFVITLAGFDATPAEEMPHPEVIEAPPFRAPATADRTKQATAEQMNQLADLIPRAQEKHGKTAEEVTESIKHSYGIESLTDLDEKQAGEAIGKLERWLTA